MPLLDSVQWRGLALALDGLAMRYQAIANNLANAETPGFKASGVSFEAQLRDALDGEPAARMVRTHPTHLAPSRASGEPEVWVDRQTSLRRDGNNVDLDREMVLLADTTMTYQALTEIAARRLAMLKTAIMDGRTG